MLKEIKDKYENIIVYDIYSVREGLYYPILDFYNRIGYKGNVKFFGLNNKFYKQGKTVELLKFYCLDVDSLIKFVLSA